MLACVSECVFYVNILIFVSKFSSGINAMLRKISKTLTTTVQLVKKDDDDTYSLNSTILFVTTSQKFKLDEEKEVTTADGRKVKNIFTIQGNILTEKQLGEKNFIITREFFDDQMIAVASIGDLICTSWCTVVE